LTYQPPTNPIPPHLAVGLGIGAIAAGVAALVVVVCTTVYRWPTAPATLTAITAAFLGASSVLVWTANRAIEHQAACLSANRDASRVEVDKARAAVRKEINSWRKEREAVDTFRLAAAFGSNSSTTSDVSHLRSVE
jgi:hypothetical protein